MNHQDKPLLHLPSPDHSRPQFHERLIGLLKGAECFYFVAEQNGQMNVSQRAPGGVFATLDEKTFAKVCNSVARFHHGDGKEVEMPPSEAQILHKSRDAIRSLPYQWDQVRRFLRATEPDDRTTAEETFEEYCSWCGDEEEPVEVNERQFSTAVRDTWRLMGRGAA